MAKHINNKTILKNSLFLYVRMLILMGVSFFTVRIVLKALGVEDYGIYNVVGGVVAMFQFLNGSLTSSSQRYFSVEIGKNNHNCLNKIFSLNIEVFGLISLGVIILAETIGLWFVNYKLTIPTERMVAANWVYQLSLLGFVFNFMSIPYNALIVSFERMKAFAWLGLAEGGFKLLVAFSILTVGSDKLITYAILMTVLSFSVMTVYMWYCRHHFPVSKFRYFWDKREAQELFAFSGWHFLGTISVVIKGTGVNLLINTFFNPAVNAARAIGYQVETAVAQFSNNFFTAVKPQMYKAYSAGELEELFQLVRRSTLMSAFLISIFAFPLILNFHFVLSLWLGDVPQYSVPFGILALINCLIDSTQAPTIAPALAHGRIKWFEIGITIIAILNLPISYMALKLGAMPQMTVIISIILSYISVFVRALFLKKMMGFPLKHYSLIILKCTIISLVIYYVLYVAMLPIKEDWIKLGCSLIASSILLIFSYYMQLNKNERNLIKSLIYSKLGLDK